MTRGAVLSATPAGASAYRSPVRSAAALVVAVVLTGFTVLLLHGTYEFEGPVVLEVTYDNGLHRGDVVLLLGWLVAMGALALLARRPHP